MLARVRTIALAAGLCITALGSQTLAQNTRSTVQPPELNLIYLPPASRFQAVAMGFREVLADLVWIRAVIATGHPSMGKRLDFIARYLEVIYALAPRFRRPYVWGGIVSIYNGQKIERRQLDQAIRLYRQGLKYFPEDHELLFGLGMILYRDVKTTAGYTPDEIRLDVAEGKTLIRKAAAFGAPPLIRQLAVSLAEKGSSDALEIEFLETQLMQAQDENLRRSLRHRLSLVGANQRADELDELRAAVEARHNARFPYLSLEQFAVLDDGLPLPAAR